MYYIVKFNNDYITNYNQSLSDWWLGNKEDAHKFNRFNVIVALCTLNKFYNRGCRYGIDSKLKVIKCI